MADIQRYLNLVTSEHADKPKFMAWLGGVLGLIDDVSTLLENFNSYFNLDAGVGAQLDILGSIVGVKRILTFQPSGGISPILTDDLYSLVLRARIARNQWDGTIEQVIEMWNNLFPNVYLVLKDNQNMSMDVLIIGLTSQLQKELVSHGYIIPKPQGVRINYSYPSGKVFAYGLENDAFGGYEDGSWIQYF